MRWPNSYRISLRRHLISAGDGPGYAVPPHGREPAEHCRLWRSPGSPNVAKAPLGGKSSARKPGAASVQRTFLKIRTCTWPAKRGA